MTLSDPAKRQAAVSYAILAVVAAVVAYAALARPVRDRVQFLASLDAQRTTYAKSTEALARSEAVSTQFELRRSASDTSTQLFHADTPALAGADLQNQLNALIAAEGGSVSSSAFREAAGDDPLTRIIVTVRLRAPMEALLRILHGIENRSPVTLVNALSVHSQGLNRVPRETDGNLDVELDVVGFLKRPLPP